MTGPDAGGGAELVRAFVALDLDAGTREAVAAATAELRQDFAQPVRWAAPETLHVTLRFLGDLPTETLGRLAAALAARAARSAPVDLRLAGAGTFPPRGRARVLWVGIDPDPALAAVHAQVEDACAAVGLGRERRPFRPHLTVGRPRTGAAIDDAALATALARVGFVAATRVASLHLMRSELTPAGARHTPIAVVPLDGPAAGGRRSVGRAG